MKKYYDAVIVGCGVAGCFAALHLPQEADILMMLDLQQGGIQRSCLGSDFWEVGNMGCAVVR